MKHNFSLEKQRRVSFCQEKQTGGSGCWAADPRHSPTPESVPARAEERSEVHLQWHRNPNPLIPGEGNGSSSRSDQIRTCSDPQSGLMKWRDFFFCPSVKLRLGACPKPVTLTDSSSNSTEFKKSIETFSSASEVSWNVHVNHLLYWTEWVELLHLTLMWPLHLFFCVVILK